MAQKLQLTTIYEIVVKRARLYILKTFWFNWRRSVEEGKKKVIEEAAIAAKWECVKVWLANTDRNNYNGDTK